MCTRDNDRELLELLKGFFNSSYRKSLSPIIYGVSSFHVVWEHMCVSLLNDFGISENHALIRSEEHTSELQSLMRNSYAVFCLKKKKHKTLITKIHIATN